MVDLQTVCCMCGDVGFPDKLFRCSKCRNRFQHSYCSNYYSECRGAIEVCDWCQCEERNSHRHGGGGGGGGGAANISSSSASLRNNNNNNSTIKSPSSSSAHANEVRSAYAGDKIKQHHREEGGAASEKAAGKTPSPRPTTRRYKLLKDVMC